MQQPIGSLTTHLHRLDLAVGVTGRWPQRYRTRHPSHWLSKVDRDHGPHVPRATLVVVARERALSMTGTSSGASSPAAREVRENYEVEKKSELVFW